MTYTTIDVDVAERVGVLTFDRPHVLNAFDSVLVRETQDALAQMVADGELRQSVVRTGTRRSLWITHPVSLRSTLWVVQG